MLNSMVPVIWSIEGFNVCRMKTNIFLLTCSLLLQARKKSLWTIEPTEGIVPPEADFQLAVTANLDDVMIFKDTVILDIENSNTYRIPVQASGIGSTIVSDKPFAPELNLGAHFR